MAKIHAPNKDYTGVSATVGFVQGKGETENPSLINWFKEHGYEVEEDREEEDQKGLSDNPLDSMTVEELKAYAQENSIDIGNSSSQSGILKKIKASIDGQQQGSEGDNDGADA